MSNVIVSDSRGGVYKVRIEFSYGECERLPFNILRRVRARLSTVPQGGLNAEAEFNIRNPGESAAFLEILDLFGQDGAFIHGSAADPSSLSRLEPVRETGEIETTLDDDLEAADDLEEEVR